MATTVTPATLKARATAFTSLDDAVVQAAINEAVRWTNEENWGTSHFDDGIFYLSCHILTEDQVLNSAGVSGGVGGLPGGPLTSERLMDWSASYAASGIFDDDALATTAWGRRYLAARARIFSPRVL